MLRDYLRTRKYLDAINRDLDREDITPEQLPIIKWKTETRLKLVNKELPDVSAVKVDQTVNANVTIDAAQIDARLKMLGIDIG